MNTIVRRRAFVGALGAGLPLILYGSRSIAQSTGAPTHIHAAEAADPVFEHITQELARIHTRMHRVGPTAEDARAFAAQLQMFRVYAGTLGFDATVRQAARALVAQHGRNPTLYLEPDLPAMRASLRRLGVDPASIRIGRSELPYASRARVFDELLQNGVLPRLGAIASALESSAPRLDGQRGSIRSIAFLADYEDCDELENEIDELEWEAAVFCALAMLFPALEPGCAGLLMALGGLQLIYKIFC